MEINIVEINASDVGLNIGRGLYLGNDLLALHIEIDIGLVDDLILKNLLNHILEGYLQEEIQWLIIDDLWKRRRDFISKKFANNKKLFEHKPTSPELYLDFKSSWGLSTVRNQKTFSKRFATFFCPTVTLEIKKF